jgi:hypothetical protein
MGRRHGSGRRNSRSNLATTWEGDRARKGSAPSLSGLHLGTTLTDKFSSSTTARLRNRRATTEMDCVGSGDAKPECVRRQHWCVVVRGWGEWSAIQRLGMSPISGNPATSLLWSLWQSSVRPSDSLVLPNQSDGRGAYYRQALEFQSPGYITYLYRLDAILRAQPSTLRIYFDRDEIVANLSPEVNLVKGAMAKVPRLFGITLAMLFCASLSAAQSQLSTC